MGSSIRVDSGTKRIEVNDDGDVILLHLGDDGFIRDFYKLVETFQQRAESVKVDESDILGSMDRVTSLSAATKEDVERLFGEGTCKKVFGDITPSIDIFLDFVYQLLPFFEEYSKNRVSKMKKYSAGRTGSV